MTMGRLLSMSAMRSLLRGMRWAAGVVASSHLCLQRTGSFLCCSFLRSALGSDATTTGS